MKRTSILFIVLMLLNTFAVFAMSTPVTCLLKGRVEKRTSKALYLMKATTDPQTINKIRIPIVNNTFEYKLYAEEQEAYQLIFEEELDEMAYKSIIFFPDASEIKLTLYPMAEGDDKNSIIGGFLNQSYSQHLKEFSLAFKSSYLMVRQKRRAAIASKSYYSVAYDSLSLLAKGAEKEKLPLLLIEMFNLQKNNADLSATGMAIKLEEQDILEKMYMKRYAYIKHHSTPVSYYMLYDDFSRHHENAYISKLSSSAYASLAKAMPEHPYTKKLDYLINGFKLQKGARFVDFKAPDLNGKSYQLSSVMKGKVTLLNLWASWCGPCISKTREVLPLYHEFKDKGFEVIGVAREFKDLENLKIALDREKHPWLTLVDLEDKHMIWNKYGLTNSGGSMVLLDEKGVILAINPTAKELEGILSGILN
ncbi:TlpA disulfide reductase family protein [Pedobacter sp. Du54]|uniref:TlpA disulfide reductase family protein n=1 Tax=Pedobacter anseongensis TaxID=3133439 RepID=UPI0030ACA792